VWKYQYQWWLVAEGEGDFTAMGHLGQFIYVNTSKNLIVVWLGTSMGGLDWDEWKALFNDIAETIK
jgi:CubicO group peptidase (beta-lactamase class C family)